MQQNTFLNVPHFGYKDEYDTDIETDGKFIKKSKLLIKYCLSS